MNPTDNSTVRVGLQEVDDTGPVQRVRASGRYGEVLGGSQYKVPRPQSYPLSANPPKGALGAYSALGGRPDQAAIGHLEHPLLRPRNLPDKAWKLYDAFGVEIGGSADGSGQGGTAQEPVNYLHATADGWVMRNAQKITFQVGNNVEIEMTSTAINIKAPDIYLVADNFVHVGVDSKNTVAPLKLMLDGAVLAKKAKSNPP